jgi:effector-binding domain-containing protein
LFFNTLKILLDKKEQLFYNDFTDPLFLIFLRRELMTQHCELLELPWQPTLIVRTRTPVQGLPQVLGKAYGAIMQHMTELGELPHGAPFVAYYNMDMQDLDIEVGFPVGKPLPARGEVKPGEMPAGKYAATTFSGPYPEMGPAYDALNKWMQENGYQPTGVVYEVYLNDPTQVAPQELQTKILFPLK